MSITDELRRYAANWGGWFYDDKDGGLIQAIGHVPAQSTPVPKVINAIADRIDAEHKHAVMSAMNDALYHANDESMAELGWVRLPKDADGVPIRVGDVMEWMDEPNVSRVVSSINLANDGWWVYVGCTGMRPDKYRHRHELTVEDVLRQFLGECESASALGYTDMPQDIFDTYTAKLRLAGDAE